MSTPDWTAFEEAVTELLRENVHPDDLARRIRELAEYEREVDAERDDD